MSGENYQTSSEQHMLIAVREIRQGIAGSTSANKSQNPFQSKTRKNSTALYRGRVSCFAPIRAGPAII